MGHSKDWVMHPEDCNYPPPARTLPPAVLERLVEEYYRFDVEMDAARQRHYDNLDDILYPTTSKEKKSS